MTYRPHPTRVAFGFREVFGFGRTDTVVRPGRRFAACGTVCTVVRVDGPTCFVTGAQGGTAVVMTSVVRGSRAVGR